MKRKTYEKNRSYSGAVKFVSHTTKDKTVNKLIQKIAERADISNLKHKNTIDSVNRPTIEWLHESLEEAMDLSVYLQRAIEVENAKQRSEE
tara:strand:+ start:2376 stop:2648 length:273 start_codon:yes stop_codon:yes gene_type:complete